MKFPRHKLYIDIKFLIISLFNLLLIKEKISKKYNNLKKCFEHYYNSENVYFISTWRLGLYFILKSYNLTKSSEVIITGIGIPDKINSVLLAGLKPVFVDLDLNSHNIDISDLKKKINNSTKVIHITYLSGLVPNMDEIKEICKENDLILIEDISQAYGANYKNKICGTFGNVSIGSFSLGKTISSNGGGVVIINDDKIKKNFENLFDNELSLPSKLFLIKLNLNQILIKILTSKLIFNFFTYYLFFLIKKISKSTFNDPEMKNKFFSSLNKDNYYKNVPFIRKNYPNTLMKKMSDSQCQIAQNCFDNLIKNNTKNQDIAKLYFENLNEKFLKNIPKNSLDYTQNVYWHFPIHIFKNYELFKDYMFQNGVDCVSYGLPLISGLDAFEEFKLNMPNSEKVKYNTIFFPLHPDFTIKDIKRLIKTINNFNYEI